MDEITSINSKGVITLPLNLRKEAGLLAGGQVQVKVTPDGLLIIPLAAFPVEIYTDKRIKEFEIEEVELSKFKIK